MKDTTSLYLGRIVDKKNFRVFIYGADGSQKLIESWDTYQNYMETGLWFASIEDAKACVKGEPEKDCVVDLNKKDEPKKGKK